ncbi:Septin-5 Cell division control-related protein 1 [Larimichthys crocea]|uniref:Septin-5 Cell division control-related protein 1 n=1 Tax=Larimichthys crocea TaxID=215358 RepID=A0A6G0I2Q0_LARCR|nr:Septin-5 Cell division control-related protein 1 [Larimichthys crocea]
MTDDGADTCSPKHGLLPEDEERKDYVGFATLPNQVHRKSVKKGFDFTLMGESGLGKSTLVNSLFLTDLHKDRKLLNAEERISQTVEITKHTVDIEEKGVKLKLTIGTRRLRGRRQQHRVVSVCTVDSWRAVTGYIDQQFEHYFRDESGLNRKNIQDNRVHCCLYFIPPFGHGLRPVDIEFMKALQDKVNVVPLIAKADCLTPTEIKKLKERLREEIDKYGIKIYQFPDCDSDEDEDFKRQDKELKDSTPFAVIGSNTVVETRGQRVRGRLYPWGIVEVENPAHCDFVKLRNILIRTHMHDLKDITSDCHYENYRAQCIQTMTSKMNADKRVESPSHCCRCPHPTMRRRNSSRRKTRRVRQLAAVHSEQTAACPSSPRREWSGGKTGRMRAARPNKTRCGNSFKPEPSRCSARSWAPETPRTRRAMRHLFRKKAAREDEALDRVISSSQPDLFVSQVGAREAQVCGKAPGSSGSGSGWEKLSRQQSASSSKLLQSHHTSSSLGSACAERLAESLSGGGRSGNSCRRCSGTAAGERGPAAVSSIKTQCFNLLWS